MFKRKKQPVILDFEANKDDEAFSPLQNSTPQKHTKLAWFCHHKKLTALFIVLGVLLIAGGTAAGIYFLNKNDVNPEPKSNTFLKLFVTKR